ncbi:2-oxoglutarate dehydrogenase E1 component [Marinicella sediminis]|uniref:oxoglutarate dehydrogenase (succinyl-transferring) n=1 Tax=Marinicella sediminis TaxID=1792834 RepID=A0ABV7JAL5_9GAMM|nr:2-oxoglutarate dehydrogenase E1 component [Marinicella sediminis]
MGSWIKEKQQSAAFFGSNSSWLEEYYDLYLEDPQSVTPELQALFKEFDQDEPDVRHLPIIEKFEMAGRLPASGGSVSGDAAHAQKQAAVLRLINSYRLRGHQKADLDPIKYSKRPDTPDLNLEFHGLSDADLDTSFNTGSLVASDELKLREIIGLLENIYCQHIGAEYMHITDIKKREWLQQRLEKPAGQFPFNDADKKRLLKELTHAEGMERYLHNKYVGQKRFSLEGGDALIPQMSFLIQHLGAQKTKELVIGMAHRGRLNMLVNILGKSPAELFDEFDGVKADELDNVNSGDVKYHKGYSSDVPTPGGDVHLAMAFNPSHLEIINPVVLGSVRARQVRRKDSNKNVVVPVLIHGDAAFEGQGVNMELFNMAMVEGYDVGGTIHVVVNNQIGFTTTHALDKKAGLYCTELAKMVQAPIFHVNGDDPEAVVFATQLAADYRLQYGMDVVIDLVCYRKHGHNEADEPSATQPHMYKLIKAHRSPREIYAEQLISQNVITADDAKQWVDEYRDRLDNKEDIVAFGPTHNNDKFAVDWTPYIEGELTEQVTTSISDERFSKYANIITTLPSDLKPHPRVNKINQDRIKMMNGDIKMDWGFAETMAYASILDEGYQIRIDGQDSQRGTFFHRHAVVHNVDVNENFTPLDELESEDNKIDIINSVLSEEAVLAFEYGYATTEPRSLVIWEAQFGDFANGAQVVIDQFISSGEAKWGRLSGLVMFLPHGFEGQGPEHSSARLERYLQLCAVNNMQVCMPSTPAQTFHMIRRQMLRKARKPLIVMTPKSLLRHKLATSTKEQLTEGRFQTVIPDRRVTKKDVKRIIFCSGKVYYDLLKQVTDEEVNTVALVRVEQLYPFPRKALTKQTDVYPNAKEVVWCQEEPINQGAWFQIRHHLQHCIADRFPLYFAGRKASPSPAVGALKVHLKEQQQLTNDAIHGEHGSAIDAE